MANFPVLFDAVAQRQLVASFFVLLQGIKVYELMINNSGSSHISWLYKWSLVDVSFLAFVNWCKIPRLERISRWRWILFAFLLSILNLAGLSVMLERFPISIHLSIGAQDSASSLLGILSLGRSRSNASMHLQGAVKVNIVPWSTIVLNPQALPVCLFHISNSYPGSDILSSAQITPWLHLDMNAPVACIPISVKGDGPWKIKMKITKSHSSSKGASEIQFQTLDIPLDLTCLKVSIPGFYEITEITDKNGNLGRVRATDPFHVVHCPELRMDPQVLANGVDICRGRVESESVPSIRLWAKGSYSPLSGSLKRVMMEEREEILVPLGVFDVSSEGELFSNLTIDLTSFEYDRIGEHVLLVDKVSDALNNTHIYGEFDIPDRAVVRVHSRPLISWSACHSGKVQMIKGSVATVKAVISEGKGPYHIFYQENGGSLKEAIIEDNEFSLVMSSPAVITLKAVRDNFCSGLIEGFADCAIALVQPPTIKTTFNAIEAACVGHVGVEVTFLFTGSAPWIVNIQEKSEHGIQTRKIISRTHNHVEMLSPQRAGTYHYEVIDFSDANYYGLEGADPMTYSQTIHPLPFARFIIPSANRLVHGCLGSAQSFKVALGGSPPWNIKVQTVFPNSTILVSTFTDIKDEIFEFHPEDLGSPGTFIFILSEVTDLLGCRKTVNNEEITLTINSIPKVSFEVERSVMTLNTPKKIPVKGIGISPWTLIVKHSQNKNSKSNSGNKKVYSSTATAAETNISFTINASDSSIVIKEPGIYEIMQVRDKVCQGTPGSKKTLIVDAVDLPSAKFQLSDESEKFVSMKKCEHSFERLLSPPIQITGRGSWTIVYRRFYLGNRNYVVGTNLDHLPHETLEFTTTRNSNVTFFLDSGLLAGNYVYELYSISDFYYANVLISEVDADFATSKRFELCVLKHPKAIFRNSNVKYQCIGESGRENRLSLEFSGFAPFSVAYEVVDEFERVQLVKQVEWSDSRYPVPLISLNQTGRFTFRLVNVSDSTGCSWEPFDDFPNIKESHLSASIQVMDSPSISLIDHHFHFHYQQQQQQQQQQGQVNDVDQIHHQKQFAYACVGERLGFQLLGSGPWTVTYQFNNESPIKDEINTDQFYVQTHEKGTLKVLSICNRLCCSDVGLEFPIHEIPSASLSGGKNIVANLRDGDAFDLSVKFTGVQPFAFSYRRILSSSEKGNVFVESKQISGIEAQEYHFPLDAAGTYELISVSDKFCRYPPE